MEKLIYLLVALPLVWSCNNGGGGATSGPVELKTFVDTASYAQGVFMSKNLERYAVEGEDPVIDPYKFAAGLEAGMNKNAMFDIDQATEILGRYQTILQQAGIRRGKKKSEAFLAENKKKEGVQVTASGLQYRVIEEGTGASPTAEDIIQAHYEGRSVDGNVFDASGDVPIKFKLNGVIKGWTEGFQLMKEGGKMQLFIPAELAYGDQGFQQLIGPAEALIFDVELIKVNP